MRSVARILVQTLVVSVLLFPGTAKAANGDLVGQVNFSEACSSGLGVGIAYDFRNLWYSCYQTYYDLYRADPLTGEVTATYHIAGGLGALSFDRVRNALWAGWGGPGTGQVRLIQLDGGKNVVSSQVMFNTGSHPIVCSLDDGLAYDNQDTTIYISDDCSHTIHHYATDGTHLSDGPNGTGDFTWIGTSCYNSGLAIGGTLLYEGSDGCRHVWVVNKTSPSTLAFDFNTPGIRDEDLECDTGTFAGQGKHVMWSKDAYTPFAYAFEIPFNSCGTGGEAVRKPTSLTYGGETAVQYSDPVSLSATLRDTSVSPNVGIPDKQLKFTLGTQSVSAGPTDANGTASTSLLVSQAPGTVSSVDSSFTQDQIYKPATDSDPFNIAKEDCTLAYSGDTLVTPGAMTTLAADLGEPDPYLGDRSNKAITFDVTGSGGGTQHFATSTDANGHASMSVALPPDAYSVAASFSGDSYYAACAAPSALVTVEAPTGKVTGGGWISIGGNRTSFGFNAIADGSGLKGHFRMQDQASGGDFRSNTVVSFSSSSRTASWSGTGYWVRQPGYRYVISVIDYGSGSSRAGQRDTISVTITDPQGNIVYTTGGRRALRGGDITVH